MITSDRLDLFSVGESVSVIKHTDPVPDPRAVNQDKKNMLFSVRTTRLMLIFSFQIKNSCCHRQSYISPYIWSRSQMQLWQLSDYFTCLVAKLAVSGHVAVCELVAEFVCFLPDDGFLLISLCVCLYPSLRAQTLLPVVP